MRVLSVASSSGAYEHNWATFDFVHSKRHNRLKPSRANDLVYVFSNSRLLNNGTNVSKLASAKPSSSIMLGNNFESLA